MFTSLTERIAEQRNDFANTSVSISLGLQLYVTWRHTKHYSFVDELLEIQEKKRFYIRDFTHMSPALYQTVIPHITLQLF